MASTSLVATCASVFLVTLWRWRDPLGGLTVAPHALMFTGALMAVLLAHELGHYVVARAHGFRLSLPTFLPAPFFVGTLGALIHLRAEPRTRTGLLEMGAAGPLVGLSGVLLLSLFWFALGPLGAPVGEVRFARPLLLWALAPLFGMPSPPELRDGDPLGLAIAVGSLLTAMNLLPFGQLDGGHVLAALAPRRAWIGAWAVTAGLLVLGLWWPGWAAWVLLLHVLGARDGLTVRRPDVPLTDRARATALAAGLAFLLTFTPAPVGW